MGDSSPLEVWDSLAERERTLLGHLSSKDRVYDTHGGLSARFGRHWGTTAFNAAIHRLAALNLIEPINVNVGRDGREVVTEGWRLTAVGSELMAWRLKLDEAGEPQVADLDRLGIRRREVYDSESVALVADAKKEGRPLALVEADVDHFKKFNDLHGHPVGDQVLEAVAGIMKSVVSGKGRCYRYGGEEMVLLLPNHSTDEAVAVAERVRREIEATAVPATNAKSGAQSVSVTASFGVACFPEHGSDAASLFRSADTALYDAKGLGRNCVRVHGEPPPQQPKSGAREASRRIPASRELSDELREDMRQEYLRGGDPVCPDDGAILRLEDVSGFGSLGKEFVADCPICGRHEKLPGPKRTE